MRLKKKIIQVSWDCWYKKVSRTIFIKWKKKIEKTLAPEQYPSVCSYKIYLKILIHRNAPVREGHLGNFYVFFSLSTKMGDYMMLNH